MPKATWLRVCAGAAIALCVQTAGAQSNDVQKGFNQLFRAIQGLQQSGAVGAQTTTAGPAAVGEVDTAQNVEVVVKEARERKHVSATTMGSDAWCQAAASPFRPARLQGSGWTELVAKCTAVLEEDERGRQQAVAAQERLRAETERVEKERAQQHSDDFGARRQALLAGLKGGTIAPKNCAQWMVGRGLDRHELQANEISRIAYRPPQGMGYFDAVIEQIQGESILVRVRDHLAVVDMDKNSRLFREGEVTEEGRIGVVGQQTGRRTLKRAYGSSLTVALVTPSCVVGAPDHLLDLAPD